VEALFLLKKDTEMSERKGLCGGANDKSGEFNFMEEK